MRAHRESPPFTGGRSIATPRALVTGATGFVGRAVLSELLAKGWRTRVLHRSSSDLRNLEGLDGDVERHVGDLREPAGLRRALEGCEYAFHVAARYQFGARYGRDLYLDNVEGTRNILAAARETGVRRVVYTSTVGVLHPRADGVPVDESALAELRQLAGPYKRSKWLAEQEVLKAADEGVPVVTVCPSAPVGPYDVKPTPTGRMILDFLLGRMSAYVDTGLNLVPVEDVAVGHLLAAEKGEIGRRYILGHQNLSLKEIFAMLAEITGRSAPRRRIPKRALIPISWISEGVAAILRRPPRISLENARMSQLYMYFDSSRAGKELGFRAGSVEDALERAVRWFEANGYLLNGVRRNERAFRAQASAERPAPRGS